MNPNEPTSPEDIQSHILFLRGHRVLLDADLAAFYGVTTKVFNQAVLRNAARFPADFRFQLRPEEVTNLKSQIVTSSLEPLESERDNSKLVSRRHGGVRKLPWVFTEHGALMAGMILHSPRATQVSLVVVRAFVALRRMVADHGALAAKLNELEKQVSAHDGQLAEIVDAIRQIIAPPGLEHGRKIGFHDGNR